MLGNVIEFNSNGKSVSGCITDIVNHANGEVVYEILANNRIHYLDKDDFKVTKQANQKVNNDVLILKKLRHSIMDSELKKQLDGLISRYD